MAEKYFSVSISQPHVDDVFYKEKSPLTELVHFNVLITIFNVLFHFLVFFFYDSSINRWQVITGFLLAQYVNGLQVTYCYCGCG